LTAFAAAVQHGAPIHTPPSDSIANMRIIDAVYRSAGMEPRGRS
jgi:predicted dehydrogenase